MWESIALSIGMCIVVGLAVWGLACILTPDEDSSYPTLPSSYNPERIHHKGLTQSYDETINQQIQRDIRDNTK